MIKQRLFLIILISCITFICLLNLGISKFYSENFTGDLGRLGKINFGKDYSKKFEADLFSERFYYEGTENLDKTEVDVVTIGDSFSQQGRIGYQNYLAQISKKKIVNIKRYSDGKDEPEQTAIILLNSGYFDKVKPKYIILESVGREFLNRNTNLNFSKQDDLQNIDKYYKSIEEKTFKKKAVFNLDNFKFIFNPLLYKINDRAVINKVYKKKLTKPLFSKRGKELYFYRDDIKNLKFQNENIIKEANNNLNILSKMFEKKGIKLIIMPAVDKYDLYQDYIVNNNYLRNTLFEKFRELEKKYIFIDTKNILLKEIENEEMDSATRFVMKSYDMLKVA